MVEMRLFKNFKFALGVSCDLCFCLYAFAALIYFLLTLQQTQQTQIITLLVYCTIISHNIVVIMRLGKTRVVYYDF